MADEWGPAARVDQGPEDLVKKVTGAARYTTDLGFADMAYAALARSMVPHGLIRSIDTSAAAAAPGVVCVFTRDDIGDMDPYYGELVLDQPIVALERVRYAGEPYCAVVADTEAAALAAAALVSVEIDPLPEVFSFDEALSDSAPAVHPERQAEDGLHPNVCRQFVLEVGDVQDAFERAAYTHEAEYRCPAVYHYAMEPHCSIASWTSDRLDVLSSTQQPFRVRDGLARMFHLPRSRVHVRAPYVGGAYGSKGETKYEPLVTALSRKAGRPVKLACSVEESFHTVTRHAASVRVRTAVDDQGRIIGRDSEVLFDTGAYADKGPRIAARGANRVSGPYKIANIRARSRAIYTNAVPAGAFRGFSSSQVLWAEESAMDEIAFELGLDPVEFRARNLLDRGDLYMTTDSPMDADLVGGLRTAADAIGLGSQTPDRVGRGLAVGVKDAGGGAGQAAAIVKLHLDGSIEVFAGATELGQGAERVLALIAANALRVSPDRVTVHLADTDSAPFDRGTNASRTTVGVGSAVADGCAKLVDQLREALRARGDSRDDFELVDDCLVVSGTRTELVELLAASSALPVRELGFLIGYGAHNVSIDPQTRRSRSLFYEVCYSTAEVRLAPETGQLQLQRFVSVTDAGKALDRKGCEGQDLGAAMMGIGTTLSEELVYADGRLINPNLIDYSVPTTRSLPSEQFTSIMIENGDGPGPFGAKGVGEAGIIAVAPAIANALFAASGIRIRELPLSPERVWQHLQAAELEQEGRRARAGVGSA